MFFAPLTYKQSVGLFIVNTPRSSQRFRYIIGIKKETKLWIRIELMNKLSKSFVNNTSKRTPIGQVQELKHNTSAEAWKRL